MKIFVLALIIILSCTQVVFANAKTQLEMVNSKEAARLFIEKHNRIQKELKEEARLKKLKKQEEAKLNKNKDKNSEPLSKTEKIKQEKEIEAKAKANLENEQQKEKVQQPKGLTNYQYDEANYHYYKLESYLQDNINYSQSGQNKY